MTGSADLTLTGSPVGHWASRIRHGMTKTVESIIEVGNILTECKAALPHGGFGECLKEAGISPRVAQMFMKVAANRVLGDTSIYSHLPAAYNSLYELSQLDDGRLEELIADETITPGTTYSNIKSLVSREKTMAEFKALRDNPEQGPPLPYRPEFGPPAPAVYECQECGDLVDPETLDTDDETADIICPVCVDRPLTRSPIPVTTESGADAAPEQPRTPLRGKAREEAFERARDGWRAYAEVERDLAWSRLVHEMLDPAWREEQEKALTPEQRQRRDTVRDFLCDQAMSPNQDGYTIEALQVTCWKPYPEEAK